MHTNEIAIIIEPEFEDTYWCNLCIQGIKSEAARNKLNIKKLDAASHDELRTLSAMPRPILILVGSLVNRMQDTARMLDRMGIHAVMVTAPVPDTRRVSTVSIDHRQAFEDLCAHLRQTGAKRIALFGVHPNSVNDLDKLHAFCACVGQSPDGADNIYWNNGHVTALCGAFYDAIDRYDAVLCTNDILAIRLKDYLLEQGIEIPARLKLATVGETRLAHLVKPGITSATLNFQDIGRHAVRLYRMLLKNPDLTALHATVHADVVVRESTGGVAYAEPIAAEPPAVCGTFPGFYEDDDVRRIFRLENLVSHCLPVDFGILKGMLAGKQYHSIAEECFIAENTLKYRIRRMQELADAASRDELLALVQQYLRPEDIPEA